MNALTPSPTRPRRTIATATLALLVLIFAAHFFIRAHHIMTLPVFADEWSHIRRAARIYDFQEHPARDGSGKFLFYFLPGIFDLKDFGWMALYLGRTIVAVASLLTTALIFVIARRLFDTRVGLLAAAIYAFLPYAFFFERMALADSWAGLMGTLLVWNSLRFVDAPNYRRAAWVGLFVALTPAAKLTLTFVGLVPVLAVAMWGQYRNPVDMLRRYFKYGFLAAVIAGGLWSTVLIPALIAYETQDVEYVFFTSRLLEPTDEGGDFFDKLSDKWEKLVLLTSLTMTLVLFASVAVGLAINRHRRATFLLVSWAVLAWIPAFFLVARHSFQSRYMMAATPALAILLAAGVFMLAERLFPQPRLAVRAVALYFATWVLLFAGPFAYHAAYDPAALELPWLDEQNYISGPHNYWGMEDALDYIDSLHPDTDPRPQVLLGHRFCGPLYTYDTLDYYCDNRFDLKDPNHPSTRDHVLAPLEAGYPVYFITGEHVRKYRTDFPSADAVVDIQYLRGFKKPVGDNLVRVWRLTLPPPDKPSE